jgi:redox-sensitive bicupin YhaK (pirin superfamily)
MESKSPLRLLDELVLAPGEGAPVSERRDEELVIVAVEGEVSFTDSAGDVRAIPAGRALLVSAGKGLAFSIFNQSSHPARFVRAVFRPKFSGGKPAVETNKKASFQKNFLRKVAGNSGKALRINCDASLSIAELTAGRILDFQSNGGTVYVLDGKVEAAGKQLERRERLTFSKGPVRLRCIRPAKLVIVNDS